MTTRFDAIIIGTGQSGPALAARLSATGMRVAMISLAACGGAETDDLDLDKSGVERDARGYVKVDDQLRTNVHGIWALGDCNGRGAFTHTSYE